MGGRELEPAFTSREVLVTEDEADSQREKQVAENRDENFSGKRAVKHPISTLHRKTRLKFMENTFIL